METASPRMRKGLRIRRIVVSAVIAPPALYIGASRILATNAAISNQDETIRLGEGEWLWIVFAGLFVYLFMTGLFGWDTKTDRKKRKLERIILVGITLAWLITFFVSSHLNTTRLEAAGYATCDVSGGRPGARQVLWSRIGCEGLEKFRVRPPGEKRHEAL